jgi:hypothetical protein
MSWLDALFGGGTVVGPFAAPAAGDVVLFDGVTGKLIKSGGPLYPPMILHGATGATETFDFTVSRLHKATIDAACVFTFTPPLVSMHCQIEFKYSGGAHVITWPVSLKFAAGLEPSWDTTGKPNTANLYWDTEDSVWLLVGSQGFA